jgi:hypothetical protein
MNDRETAKVIKLAVLDPKTAKAIFGMIRYLTYDSAEHKDYAGRAPQDRTHHIWRDVEAAARWLVTCTKGELQESVLGLLNHASEWTDGPGALAHEPPSRPRGLFDG